ncbi:MFS transporter [Methylobacillus glycogenes]|uniref:MFS transporter n=1 Tax=Methylobacillus glycogenes TaxID=406 RepID=UPI001F1BF10E|nr:MFS transporter [Methylobacillus glycogenes]
MLVGDVAQAFGVSPSQASWVVSAVALIAALFSPIVNWIVAHTGERKSIVAGLAIAAVASYLGGLSQDFSHLLVLRVIEGAGYITVVLAALA